VRSLALLLFLAACDQTAEIGSLHAAQQRIIASQGGPARPVHGTAAGWSATLRPAKGWESRVNETRLIGPRADLRPQPRVSARMPRLSLHNETKSGLPREKV